MNRKHQIINISLLGIFSLLAYVIHYFSPLQSDDFTFSSFGYSDIGKRYFSWTGRLVAEFFAVTLTNFSNKILLALIQTVGMTALLCILSQIPFRTSGQKFNAFSFALIASFYWLFHPDLGQSTFWIVGAAVYMWTGIVVYLYVFYVLKYYYSAKPINKPFSSILIFMVLPFMAGCTNENVGPFVAIFSWMLFMASFYFEKKLKKNLLFAAIFSSLGAAVLILAPGNQRRLENWEHSSGIQWGELSLMDKFHRFDDQYLAFFTIPLLLLLVIYLIFIFTKKFGLLTKRKLSFLSISIVFLLLSFVANEVLMLTPTTFVRAVSGSFLFLLLALSFAYHELFNAFSKKSNFKVGISLIPVLACVFFFLLYFGKVLPLYQSYYSQNQVQLNLIHQALEKGEKEVKIPRIYTPSNLKDKRLDMDYFENTESLAAYYGFEKFEYFSVQEDLTEIQSFDDMHSRVFRLKIEIKSSMNFGFNLAYKTNPEDDYTNQNKIWNNVKKRPDEFQVITFDLPVGKKITDLRLDIGGEDQSEFEVGTLWIESFAGVIEIPAEDFRNYFQNNSGLNYNPDTKQYKSLRTKENPVWANLIETELLTELLKEIFQDE
ncbi:MAG: DUF6056 family protein [Weeksellaceae bacterium]